MNNVTNHSETTKYLSGDNAFSQYVSKCMHVGFFFFHNEPELG